MSTPAVPIYSLSDLVDKEWHADNESPPPLVKAWLVPEQELPNNSVPDPLQYPSASSTVIDLGSITPLAVPENYRNSPPQQQQQQQAGITDNHNVDSSSSSGNSNSTAGSSSRVASRPCPSSLSSEPDESPERVELEVSTPLTQREFLRTRNRRPPIPDNHCCLDNNRNNYSSSTDRTLSQIRPRPQQQQQPQQLLQIPPYSSSSSPSLSSRAAASSTTITVTTTTMTVVNDFVWVNPGEDMDPPALQQSMPSTPSSSSCYSSNSPQQSPSSLSSPPPTPQQSPPSPAQVADQVKKEERKRRIGAGVATGVVGLLVGGPVVAVLVGCGAAYATRTKGAAGDAARAIGDVALQISRKAQDVNRKHHVVERSQETAIVTWNAAQQQVVRHLPSKDDAERLVLQTRHVADEALRQIVDFIRRHELLERSKETFRLAISQTTTHMRRIGQQPQQEVQRRMEVEGDPPAQQQPQQTPSLETRTFIVSLY